MIPFLIPFLIAMAIGPKLKWIKSNLSNKIYLFLMLIISLLSFFIIKILDTGFLINTILLSCAFYLFFITLRDFFIKDFKNLSQNLAHFGFSLFILSILLNNLLSTEIITNLKIGETFQSDKVKINFERVDQTNQKNFKAIRENLILKILMELQKS